MALSPSMSVPLGSRGVYECSVLSCAWKAPRVLSGFFASTTQSSSSSSSYQTHKWRTRSGSHLVSKTKFNQITRKSDSSLYKRFLNTNSTLNDTKWRLWCSSSESYDSINPESLWESLEPSISYLPPEELNLVHNSLKLAFEAHNGQKRKSGEPFIIHPVEVARILGELELDWESIAAGLLHDTVEDTDLVTFESIEKEFGSTVRNIVEGETKVSKLGKIKRKGDESNSKQDVKADDLIQMFLAMTEDVRVIIVKLADRLHNMRTLSHMPPHKQSAIARETLKVFAPLAKRLGMYQIKAELEYLSFMYTNPSDFHKLSERVEEFCRVHEKELEEAKRILKKKIEEDQYLNFVAVQTEVHSCYKELYSTYETMLQSTNSMSEVNLIAQLRIVIKPKIGEVVGPFCSPQQVCYHVLGLVHGIWTPVPQAVKDYIATPKPNAYQSLHTTVIPFLKESMFRLEVQIRTDAMDLIAERGIAAHYSGKQGTEIQFNNTGKALRIGWLNAIKEWQEEFVGNMSSREFVDAITVDLLGSRVFVFTPKGEIKDLPKGATVIDYAYLIHTEIGNKMIGAKVNGNKCSPIHELANAEVVEIITSDTIPSKIAFEWHEQWLQHAKTRSARHKIMKFLREQAQLCALELTADRVSDFVADLDADKKQLFSKKPSPNKTPQKALNIGNNHSMKAQKDLVHVNHITASFPKRAPKFNGSGLVKDHELLETVETWKADKIAAWHSVEGNSVNWLCIVYIVCVERRGMMAEVTSALTANRISICSCAVETDRRKGLGVMLFHFEGSHDNLGNAFKSIGEIQGVLGRSVGCSWMIPSDNHWSI